MLELLTIQQMNKENTIFNLTFIPTNMVSAWKRTSLSSNFCALILSHIENKSLENTFSTLFNELLELCVKFGENKDSPYNLAFNKSKKESEITLKLYLKPTQVKQLKVLINASSKKNFIENINEKFFTTEFAELGVSVYNFTQLFNGKINLHDKPYKGNLETEIQLTINKETL
ncbi:hypothetical protein DID78_04535 [Candidatus Marinamargulisbacteria bacterium SCGC AG-343-D04]|nr:hypothetical protein DID78_04535 [Candidatus Marinamargulisbacteria bacterium SCGC AG-343-D04]